jgi:radical SAM protein (TIGR01212 family)
MQTSQIIYPWGNERRYNSYAEYFRRHFGTRVQKISIDAGFTCPNRDGSKGTGGCTYCNNDAFNPSYCSPAKTIKTQILEGIGFHHRRYRRAEKFLAYFQAYSNTYDTLDNLKRKYDQALSVDKVVGLVIGTRPDCIDDEKLAYFADIAKTHYVIIEYGLESCYDETLKRINRGHTFQESKNALELTASYGLKTGAHFIFGLPGETHEMILQQAEIVSSLQLTTIKFHQLQIVKNTAMEKEFRKNPSGFSFFEVENYIDLVVRFIARLTPEIVIERFAGEVPPAHIAGPHWGPLRYDRVLQMIEGELEKRDTWQGKFFFKD